MKMKFFGLVAAAALVSVSFSAQAALMVAGDSPYYLEGPLGNPDSELAFVNRVLEKDLEYLDKYDVGKDPWDGDGEINGANWFKVDIDGSTGTVGWNLDSSGFQLHAVLVKDGVVQGKGHLYNLFSVTPDQWLMSAGEDIFFGPSLEKSIDKGISHVTFFGSPSVPVPAPATLLLLGTGLILLGLVRRRHGLA